MPQAWRVSGGSSLGPRSTGHRHRDKLKAVGAARLNLSRGSSRRRPREPIDRSGRGAVAAELPPVISCPSVIRWKYLMGHGGSSTGRHVCQSPPARGRATFRYERSSPSNRANSLASRSALARRAHVQVVPQRGQWRPRRSTLRIDSCPVVSRQDAHMYGLATTLECCQRANPSTWLSLKGASMNAQR